VARRVRITRLLREQIDRLERHVLRHQLATQEEIDAYRPGGEDNPNKKSSTWGRIRYYANLVRFCGREERAERTSEDIDRVILQALRAEPEVVELEDGSTIDVHPKGMAALLDLDLREKVLTWCGTRYAALLELLENGQAEPDLIELADRTKVELNKQQGAIAWIACSPGPRPPFDSFTADPPDIPDRFVHLGIVDLVRINTAFHVVNSGRLQALDAFLTRRHRKEGQEKPTWAQFVGNLSRSFKRPPKQLMYDSSLAELLATIATTAPPPKEERSRKTA
jgi:hypothetical protein